MAKKIIQMYDKYQSTTKVYPKVLEECLPEDYQGLPDTVEDIPVVVANPTLAGTEGDLEGIQVGDTKYKIGGGKQLYQHNLNWGVDSNGLKTNLHGLFIINDSPTPFTFNTLLQWLSSHGYEQSSATDFTHRYSAGAYGTRAYGDGSYQFLGMTKSYGNNFITLILRNTSYDGVISSLDTDGFKEDIIPL